MRRGNNTKVYRKHIHKEDEDYWNKNLHEETKRTNQKYTNKKSKSNLSRHQNNNYNRQINDDFDNYTEEELSKDILRDLSDDNQYENDNQGYDLDKENYIPNSNKEYYPDYDLNNNGKDLEHIGEYNPEYSPNHNASADDFKPIFFNEENIKNMDDTQNIKESDGLLNFKQDDDLLMQDKFNKLNNLENKKALFEYIDLRIIVNNSQNAEYLNKICKNIDFSQFNINLSAVIQTDNINIAKIATFGADIIIIAEGEDKTLYGEFYNDLKTENNYVEPFSILDSNVNLKYLESKLNKAIIKIGLSSLLNINHFKSIKNDLDLTNINYDKIKSENDTLKSDNDELKNRLLELESENDNLSSNINNLQKVNDELKSEIADFKTRYSNIHTERILEIFSLPQLWNDTFNEVLDDEEKVVIATNEFRPENIIIGQGFIGALSVDEAIDWLRVVRTALIFVNLHKE